MKKITIFLIITMASALLFTGCNSKSTKKSESDKVENSAKSNETGTPDSIPMGDRGRRMYFELTCNKGHFGNCAQLAKMYGHGWGGKRDPQKAQKYHALACEHGVEQSCVDVKKKLSFAEEVKIYQKDCALNNGYACNNLGHLLWLGPASVNNVTAARAPLEKGCQLKMHTSCASAAKMWKMGIGGEKNEEKAKQFDADAQKYKNEDEQLKAKYHLFVPEKELPRAIPQKGLLKIETDADGGFLRIKNSKEGDRTGHEGHDHEGHNHAH